MDVDREAAERYRKLPGPLGDRLRDVLRDTADGTVMTIENRRCPMWRQDGLCRIQAELGHDALCKTCREFPRLRHDHGDFAELGLELSCPEAARLILNAPSHGMLVRAFPGGEAPEYDPEVMEILRSSREEILVFLETSAYTLPEMLAVLLLYSHSVQAAIDGDTLAAFAPEALLAEARGYAGAGELDSLVRFFQQLEILTPQWRKRLSCVDAPGNWPPQLRALAIYMVQRYWLQAISDYDLVCRAKLTVIACLLVNALGGEVVQTAQLFSKEIENDPDNIEAILNGAYTDPAFTDCNLFSLLLTQKSENPP